MQDSVESSNEAVHCNHPITTWLTFFFQTCKWTYSSHESCERQKANGQNPKDFSRAHKVSGNSCKQPLAVVLSEFGMSSTIHSWQTYVVGCQWGIMSLSLQQCQRHRELESKPPRVFYPSGEAHHLHLCKWKQLASLWVCQHPICAMDANSNKKCSAFITHQTKAASTLHSLWLQSTSKQEREDL